MSKRTASTCEDCYFRCNLLCALSLDEPCTTFRPDHPDGLRPPRQMRFEFRQERRTQAAWTFRAATGRLEPPPQPRLVLRSVAPQMPQAVGAA